MPQEHDTQPLTLPTSSVAAGSTNEHQSTDPARPKRRLALYAWIGGSLIVASITAALLVPQLQGNAAEPPPQTQTETKPAPTTGKPTTPGAGVEPQSPGSSAPPVHAPSDPTAHDRQVLAFTAFQPSGAAVLCTDDTQVHPITFSWQSQNAVAAWFGIDTPNAQAAPLQEVSPAGSITWDFFCSNQATTYTITLADADGALAHRSVVVERR